MGVEARLQSYVQVNDQVSIALKNGWKIHKLFQGLERTFSNSSKVVEFVTSVPGIDPVVLHFIPVSARLKRSAERFGEALHITADSHSAEQWWNQLRMSVDEAILDLNICAKATLLGVPLFEPRTGQVHTKFEFHTDDPRFALMKGLAATKEPHSFRVSYVDTEDFYAQARLAGGHLPLSTVA